MSPKDASSQSSSLLRFVVKGVIAVVVIGVIIAIAAFFALPSLISSDFGREKAVAALARELQRPVSMDTLSFSWRKGVAIAGLTVKNQDQSPLLALDNFQVTVSWPDLLARKISVQTLTVDGIEVTLTRDASGKINISDLLEAPEKETPARKEPKPRPKEIPALFLDAHLKNGNFIFIDERLDTTTRIQNLHADVSVQTLTEPIELLCNGEIVVNGKSPDQVAISGLVHLAPEGKIDPRKAQGKMEMKAGFGNLNAVFDLAKFDTTGEATGASLSCSIDLKKLGQLGAGIFGFPPDFSMKGRVTSNLKARGNLQSQIAVQGDTRLSNLALAGGPFKDAPLRQPQIDFVQDITLNYTKDVIEISSLDLKGGFFNLAASGSVSDFQKDPTCALQLKGGGNLREITKVVGKLLSLPSDVKIAGMMNFAFSAKGPQSTLHVKGKTAIRDLAIDAPWLKGNPFREKSLEITPDCLINVLQKSFEITSLRLKSGILNGALEGTLDSEQRIDMNLRLSASLANVRRQLSHMLPPTFPSRGTLSSQVALQGTLEKSLSVEGNHSIEGAVITLPPAAENQNPSAPVAIPKLTVNHDLVYALDQDTLTLSKLKANSSLFSFEGSGTLSQISKSQVAKCQGDLALNLTEMSTLLNALLPEALTSEGKGALTFDLEGSLAPPADTPLFSLWNGNGSLSLESLEYQGLGIIKNLRSTNLSLEKGLLHFALECLLNDGPSQFQGTFDFNKKPPDMKISLEGKEVQVSQDLDLLGYVVPILITSSSGKLSGEGNFSVQTSWQGTDWNSEVSRTITGKGTLNLKDGILKSEDVLSVILKSFGKPETIEFEEILTGFRLGEGKLFNDNIQVNGKDLKIGLRGWTALAYDPSKKGNPMDYTVTGDFLKESIGRDGEKVLAILGGGEPTIPVGIGGTVQKPKVSIKMPKAGDLLKGLFAP